MKILVISLAGIGDTLFATPLIHELRLIYPEATIDAFVLWKGAADVLRHNPYLNQVFQHNLLREPIGSSLRMIGGLRKSGYDLSFNTHPQSKVHYRAVAKMIAARARFSHSYGNWGAFDRVFMTKTLPQNYSLHCIENNLALLSLAGKKPAGNHHNYELFLTEAETKWALDFITANGLAGQTLVGMHVGSGGTKNLALRRWPAEHYIDLINNLATNNRIRVLLFGGPEEQADHQVILAKVPSASAMAVGAPSLRHAAALLKHTPLFLSVDTALMHVAAAMGVRNQFAIETPTWNKTIEPYKNPFVLIRNPALSGNNLEHYQYNGKGICGTTDQIRSQMRSISPAAVYNELVKAIAGTAPASKT